MPSKNLSTIQPLVANQEQNGTNLSVTFRCPETGVEAQGKAKIQTEEGVQAAAERSVKKHGWASLRRAVTKTISSSLGSGMAGKIARDVAGSALGTKGRGQEFTRDEVGAAVVEAFSMVESKFRWDESVGRWLGQTS